MRKSPSPSPASKSTRKVQTNAPELEYHRMIQGQEPSTPEQQAMANYVTPPNLVVGRGGIDYPFQTPRPSTSKAIRKEKVPEHELSALRQAAQSNSSYRNERYHSSSIHSIPESSAMSFTEAPLPPPNYSMHHQSINQLHSSSMGQYHHVPGLSHKQWHSCADINEEQGHFSEPLSEFTMNQSAFRDDIFIHSPKRNRHYGNLHEQYDRDYTGNAPPHHSYHDNYSSHGTAGGSFTSLPAQPVRRDSRGRSTSPSPSPPRIRTLGHQSSSKSNLHKSLAAKVVFEPRKDPRLESSGGGHHYDSSNYSSVSSQRGESFQSLGHPSPVDQGSVSGDLAQWQQKHQMHLKRQQIYVAQESYDGQDPYKWDALKRAADGIISDKDMIIERLKNKVQDLELVTKEKEEHVKVALSLVDKDNSEMMKMKLQEIQFDSTSSRGQLQETIKLKDELIAQLQQILGNVELENKKMKEELKEKEGFTKDDFETLKVKVANKEKLVVDWQEKHQELMDEFKEKKEKLSSLERYIADLPTRDDYSSKNQELKNLRGNEVIFKNRISDLELSVSDMEAVLRTKDNRIQCLEKTQEDLGAKIDGYKLELERFKKPSQEGQLPADDNDIDDLRWENQKLKSDFEKAKKLLETRHKKYQQVEAKHQMKVKQLEEQITQDESLVNALRDEMMGKDVEVKKLSVSIKEFGRKNQDLMEKNMKLQDKAKELDRLLSSDQQRLQRKLIREMNLTVSQLQSMIQFCTKRAEGQDPNISALLGVHSLPVSESEDEGSGNGNDAQALRQKLTQVRELRNEIDNIRGVISTKFAEDYGNICVTQ